VGDLPPLPTQLGTIQTVNAKTKVVRVDERKPVTPLLWGYPLKFFYFLEVARDTLGILCVWISRDILGCPKSTRERRSECSEASLGL
jgi:hypothetical protein